MEEAKDLLCAATDEETSINKISLFTARTVLLVCWDCQLVGQLFVGTNNLRRFFYAQY